MGNRGLTPESSQQNRHPKIEYYGGKFLEGYSLLFSALVAIELGVDIMAKLPAGSDVRNLIILAGTATVGKTMHESGAKMLTKSSDKPDTYC